VGSVTLSRMAEPAAGTLSKRLPGRVSRRLPPRYLSLFWRVFLTNALVLALASLVAVLVLSPTLFHSPIVFEELAIFFGALALMLVLNLALTRRIVAPLDELVRAMRSVDPLERGGRVTVRGQASEATELAAAFNGMLERLEDERAESVRSALIAQEAERLRVAQELHDEVGQNLTAALLQLGRVRKLAPDELGEQLGEGIETVRENLEELRRIAGRLRPGALEELGLPSALSELGDRLRDQAGLRVERRFDGPLPELSPEQELVVYRVAQEALTNVVRHAHATRAELRLERSPGALTLHVRDDGDGIDDAQPPGAGIQGMRERAAVVQARLSLRAQDGGGTEVTLILPLEQTRA
jgi:two-component system, NarL family, sensor histidine kinase UhpB